ncbi:MAG: SirA family protein [Peptococcaceae bacterium]|nr:MAG: SirA family protein [Peptococcaceae bacterium]
MREIIDARGLLCPEPVLMVKREMEKRGVGMVKVLANTAPARENISRLARNQGWQVTIAAAGEDCLITLVK